MHGDMLIPFSNTTNMREIYRIPDQTAAIIIYEASNIYDALRCLSYIRCSDWDGFSVVTTFN